MNRLTTFVVAGLMVVGIATLSISNASAAFLKIDIAAPDENINSRSFNVEYTALSTDEVASIDVTLTQDGAVISTDTTTTPFGNSGAFFVTVPADGTYEYQFNATSGASWRSLQKLKL